LSLILPLPAEVADMNQILPCPFCSSTNITHYTNVTGDYGGHELECNNCGANPCEQEITYADAKLKWNTRYKPKGILK